MQENISPALHTNEIRVVAQAAGSRRARVNRRQADVLLRFGRCYASIIIDVKGGANGDEPHLGTIPVPRKSRSALNCVSFDTAHMSDTQIRLVDLHVASANPIRARGPGEHVRSPNQNVAVSGERNAGFAAPQNHLAFPSKLNALTVDFDFDV